MVATAEVVPPNLVQWAIVTEIYKKISGMIPPTSDFAGMIRYWAGCHFLKVRKRTQISVLRTEFYSSDRVGRTSDG